MLLAATFLVFALCVAIVLFPDWDEATKLNFTVERCHMAKIGDVFVGRIAPTNAAGAPAPVFNAVYFEEGEAYDVSVSPDGLTATFVAKASGVGNTATVTATTKGGTVLTESRALPDVDAPVDEEAVALNFDIQPA